MTTLVSLILLASLAVAIHTRSLNAARLWASLRDEHQSYADQQALRELARPLVGQAMVEFDTSGGIPLNGAPFQVTYRGHVHQLAIQDLDGMLDFMRSTQADWDRHLPADHDELNKPDVDPNTLLSLSHALALATVSSQIDGDLATFMTLRKPSRAISSGTMSFKLNSNTETSPSVSQPSEVSLFFE